MKRRSFLEWMGLSAVVATAGIEALAAEFDPERALWVPGSRTFFLPSPKPLVSGEAAVQAFDAIKASSVATRVVQTAAGRVELDDYWNLVTINGQGVTARDAARMRLMHYQPFAHEPNVATLRKEIDEVIAARVQAGWPDPVGRLNPVDRSRRRM